MSENETNDLDRLIGEDGWATLSKELQRLFVAGGCNPACHACERRILPGDRFHLKPFFMKTVKGEYGVEIDSESETVSSIDVMVCEKCSLKNKRLPEYQAETVLEAADKNGLIQKGEVAGASRVQQKARESTPPTHHYGCMVVNRDGVRTVLP